MWGKINIENLVKKNEKKQNRFRENIINNNINNNKNENENNRIQKKNNIKEDNGDNQEDEKTNLLEDNNNNSKDVKRELPKNFISQPEKKDKDKDKGEDRKYKLTENEYTLLIIAEYEYNDLFPEILKHIIANFFSSLQNIYNKLSPKNIIFPNSTIDKILLKIIEMSYYVNDYSRLLN